MPERDSACEPSGSPHRPDPHPARPCSLPYSAVLPSCPSPGACEDSVNHSMSFSPASRSEHFSICGYERLPRAFHEKQLNTFLARLTWRVLFYERVVVRMDLL